MFAPMGAACNGLVHEMKLPWQLGKRRHVQNFSCTPTWTNLPGAAAVAWIFSCCPAQRVGI